MLSEYVWKDTVMEDWIGSTERIVLVSRSPMAGGPKTVVLVVIASDVGYPEKTEY